MSRRENINRRKLSFLGFNTRGGDGNTDPDEVQLDTEMEKVFAGVENDEKFDLAKLVEKSNPTPDNIASNQSEQKFEETEFNTHLSTAYPQPHSAFSQHNLNLNTKSPDILSPTETTVTTPDSSTEPSSPTAPLSSFDDPQISQRSTTEGYGGQSDTSSEVKHISFNNKSNNEKNKDDSLVDEMDVHKRRRKGKYYQKSRKYSLQEYGSFKNLGNDRRISVQPEDEALKEMDIDELTSHRSDDPRGMRRHRLYSNSHTTYINQNGTTPMQSKKSIDHSPHEVFVQLDELMGSGEDREWKETARWIKYEEDLEEGADRWGRPHVAPLSFHSLLNLRRCLETGVVLLDLDEKDIASVAYRIVEQMCTDELISEDDKPTVMRSLLLKHRHVNDHSHGSFHFGAKRKYSSYTSLQNINDDKKPKIIPINENNGIDSTTIDIKEETYTSSQEDLKRNTMNDTIFKRIPQGAEATTVLVGSVDFLEQPTIAFVRLAEGIQMPSVTEVPVPVRFLFILLGPKTAELDYHEVGRSIATLMSSAHFHNIAYKAEERKELLSAINEFLDDSIVLPPGDWESHTLLPFDELKAKKDMIRSRKKRALEAKKRKQTMMDEEKKLLASSGDDDGSKKPIRNPLERTHRPWGGLFNDIKRRYPMYKSDILDGLNTETLAATIFMYFAALSTAITFGGLASDKTYNAIGISETLISCSLVGVCFHLLSGQPLVIIGTTGPLLLFDEALYEFCRDYDYKFLTVRVYIGIWLVVIALVVSAFEGSVLVRLFTRFTQEIFSALITLIYIVETFMKLIFVFGRHPILWYYAYKPNKTIIAENRYSEAFTATTFDPLNDFIKNSTDMINETKSIENFQMILLANDNQTTTLLDPLDKFGLKNRPNTALFCLILTLGTFTLAYYLKLFRNSHFLGRNARRALGDFGVPISIAIFVLIDFLLPEIFTEKLTVPDGISPSDPKRNWMVPINIEVWWVPCICGIPAMLVYILIFMETHISELIVDKPERGLKKGSGLHMDIVLLCLLNMGCGMLGMPWHCAATVRSVTHVSAVTIMSRTHAPGEKPHIADVKEQRISGFAVSVLVGLSVLMSPILRQIPMSVLFGVFLYMGIASMSGVQLFERIRLLFMPVKHHPSTIFVRRVPTWKMHIFTLVQVFCLAVLWAVKSSRYSLAFPFFLILMVPLRIKLGKFFTDVELKSLDGYQVDPDAEAEPDFYEQAPIPA